MKKQLLIAAVAATMTSVAFADISITGGSKVNYTNTDYELATKNDSNAFAHDTDFTIVGKNGGTAVSMTFATTSATSTGAVTSTSTSTSATSGTTTTTTTTTTSTTTANAGGLKTEDVFMTSSVGDVNVKVGTWDNGNDFVSASARSANKFSANTTVSGVKVTYDAANASDEAVTVSGSMGGVNASYKQETAGEEIKLSTTVAGVSLAYHADNSDAANLDRSSIEVSGEVSGIKLSYVQIDADTGVAIDSDSWAGDFENSTYTQATDAVTTNAYDLSKGQDVTALKASMAVAGNTVAFTRTDIDDVTGEDTSINKFTVTRPLASGATFEATYTSISDDKSTTTDADILDLELAVKF